MISSRPDLNSLALGMLEHDSKLLDVARRVSSQDLPVLGGVAVFLHGYRRTTEDIDLFTADTTAARAAIEALGGTWDDARREFILDGVPVHLVTARETSDAPKLVSEVEGVRVVSLADLIRFKLHSGLNTPGRTQDIADVEGLVRNIPLDKSFAAKLPSELRSPFKSIVEAVHGS